MGETIHEPSREEGGFTRSAPIARSLAGWGSALLEVVGYDELCAPGDIDDLALATEDTIAPIAPAVTHVLHPQELSIADQVAAVRHAHLIAGSAGSAMYLGAFARRGARKLIISPRNLTFRDDQLISHLRGEQLAYFLCAPGDPHVNPRKADFQVELEHLDIAIDRWIAAGESQS
jgi:hypothetical protein